LAPPYFVSRPGQPITITEAVSYSADAAAMSVIIFIVGAVLALAVLLIFAAWLTPKPPIDPED
jgi:hypothetical protein